MKIVLVSEEATHCIRVQMFTTLFIEHRKEEATKGVAHAK